MNSRKKTDLVESEGFTVPVPDGLLKQAVQLKRMNTREIYHVLAKIYTEAWLEGHRLGGADIDGAIIMDEDEARKKGLDI